MGLGLILECHNAFQWDLAAAADAEAAVCLYFKTNSVKYKTIFQKYFIIYNIFIIYFISIVSCNLIRGGSMSISTV